MRTPSVRWRRVLGLRRGDGHSAGEPPHGHVQDGSGQGPRHGGRPGTPRTRCAQPARDGRLRVPDRAQLQSDRARHHGGREGLGHGQADVGRVRAREQQRATVVRRITRAPDDKRFCEGKKNKKKNCYFKLPSRQRRLQQDVTYFRNESPFLNLF